MTKMQLKERMTQIVKEYMDKGYVLTGDDSSYGFEFKEVLMHPKTKDSVMIALRVQCNSNDSFREELVPCIFGMKDSGFPNRMSPIDLPDTYANVGSYRKPWYVPFNEKDEIIEKQHKRYYRNQCYSTSKHKRIFVTKRFLRETQKEVC